MWQPCDINYKVRLRKCAYKLSKLYCGYKIDKYSEEWTMNGLHIYYRSIWTICLYNRLIFTFAFGLSIGISMALACATSRGRYEILYPSNSPWIVFSSGGCQLMNNDVLDVLCAAVTRGFPEGPWNLINHCNEYHYSFRFSFL